MGARLLWSEFQQLVCPHSCQSHRMSTVWTLCIDTDACSAHAACQLACVSELASEATNKVSLVSRTLRRCSVTTFQLLALPYRPLAIMIRCFSFFCGDDGALLSSSCMILAVASSTQMRGLSGCTAPQRLPPERKQRCLVRELGLQFTGGFNKAGCCISTLHTAMLSEHCCKHRCTSDSASYIFDITDEHHTLNIFVT